MPKMLLKTDQAAQSLSSFNRLSKSKFLSGLQCHKRLYLEIHSPELAAKPDEQTQAILDMGTTIGVLARERFPGGVLVEAGHRHSKEALRRTAELIADPTVPAIFEGAFFFDHVLVRVDILERVPNDEDGTSRWRLIEVKSSTRVKDVHLDDLAVQSHVLIGAGLELAGACLMHINNRYVYGGGEFDLDALFSVQELTDAVRARLTNVPEGLADMKSMLLVPLAPSIKPDGHCHAPYECPFWSHCTKDKPERWIYHLPGGGKVMQQFLRQGIETIDEIPASFPLSAVQKRMKNNVEWISPRLKTALRSVRYPVHHLDFETFMPATPRFPTTRPYQAIPTQWSNHIQTEGGEVRHDEYLCVEPKDPREELVKALLDSVGTEGSICVYSAYERAILERLAESLPNLRREIQAVMGRLWDLFPVIRDHYYHPAFKGSFSIKSVLPALVPELTYSDLEVQEGGIAAQLYDRMIFQETDWVEQVRIREALLKYCERDTLAMVELRRVLLEKTLSVPDRT